MYRSEAIWPSRRSIRKSSDCLEHLVYSHLPCPYHRRVRQSHEGIRIGISRMFLFEECQVVPVWNCQIPSVAKDADCCPDVTIFEFRTDSRQRLLFLTP